MKRRNFLKAIPPFLISVGCKDSCSILGPGNYPLLEIWSKFLGIHTFSWHENLQQPHLDPLFRAGLVRGIRLDYTPESENAARWAKERGADVLCIFSNDLLREPNIEELFDYVVVSNPSVDYWEIGNEVGNFSGMDPEEYMPIFLRLHEHVQKNHLGLVIIPYAPVGGNKGAKSFEIMMNNGLQDLTTRQRGGIKVISLHAYGNSILFYSRIKKEIERLPIDVQIWVTETGVADFSKQVPYVLNTYPKIRTMFRASRIYWYVASECSEYSLIGGLASDCAGTVTYSPLYQQLINLNQPSF